MGGEIFDRLNLGKRCSIHSNMSVSKLVMCEGTEEVRSTKIDLV